MRPSTQLILILLSFFAPGIVWCESQTGNISDVAPQNTYFSHAPPGTDQLSNELVAKFQKLKEERGIDYIPRTRHLRSDGWAKFTNRLFLETSPYLLQHAHNPVNWYSWGDEAFEIAKKLNRPVLLSVGYSTCHWCHVMEEESFEDEEIARFMNENYIAIKVDREERPDIDGVYMNAVQVISGSGGWPMTVWLAPDKRPFYGGTYFPPRDGARGARPGFLTLLQKLRAAYNEDPDGVKSSGEQLASRIRASLKPVSGVTSLRLDYIAEAISKYKAGFDPIFGGVGSSPKFPSSLPIRLLLRYYRRHPENTVLEMATKTLDSMAAGGMYDQVGGGFHRYSTDQRWLVPHFEKMLYDNALLVPAYLEAFQVTANPAYRLIVDEILTYILRDMTSPLGGFYSATDADSMTPSGKREEGWFFTWTPSEIDQVLTKEEASFVKAFYGVSAPGDLEGRSILHASRLLLEVTKQLSISAEHAETLLKSAKQKLYEARKLRPHPLRDEKILTAWNGLTISALAKAHLILGKAEYLEAAKRSANFVLKNLYKKGTLYRTFKDGKAKYDGYLEDYAFFIAALLDLYETSGEAEWLRWAIELAAILTKEFEDKDVGGFFMTSARHEKLIAREKSAYDGAEPSGNSVAILDLLRLSELTTDQAYSAHAERALKAFSVSLNTQPTALSEMMLALDFYLDKPKEIVIVADKGRENERAPFISELALTFIPNRVLSFFTTADAAHKKIVPYLEGKLPRGGQATAYVCEQGVCKLPTNDPRVFKDQIMQ